MKIKYIAICLVLLCCIIGTASAAEDISTDVVSDCVDDAVVVDAVQEDIEDSVSTEPETLSDDISEEQIDDEINVVEKDSNNDNTDLNRGTPVNAYTWSELSEKCSSIGAKDITLAGTIYTADSQITFKNSATIIGTSTSYITGGTNALTPFYNSNSARTISFINVRFVNMNVNNLLELGGTVNLENCTFDNINTSLGHNSVVYNIQGTMDIVGCNFTNNNVGYGTITNYNNQTLSDATMTVTNCKFINNRAEVEPGAINNCGNLEVTDSEFTNNFAKWWAGAIHTHNYANTTINACNFTNNGAGWNGGALYTYSKLIVYNSNFVNNSCNTSAGGGAIGASSGWMSTVNYNITIENCYFENNENNVSLTNQTPAQGNGGAISAMNTGILNVHGSTFVNNFAARGQAISAYGAGYISPEGNITEGTPKVMIYNNTFRDHNRTTTTDTAYLTGNYTLANNTFINCHQANTGAPNINTFINCTPTSVNNGKSIISKNVLSSSLLQDINDDKYVNASLIRDNYELGDGNSWETAFGWEWEGDYGYNGLVYAASRVNDNGTIHIYGNPIFIDEDSPEDPDSRGDIHPKKNVTFLGYEEASIRNVYFFTEFPDDFSIFTFKNLIFNNSVFSKNCNFINCTFLNNQFKSNYNFTFENCVFKDYESSSPLITIGNAASLKLYDCIFNNIITDCVFYNDEDTPEIYVSIYDSNFTNCNFNGVIGTPKDIDLEDYCAIENCDYDFETTIGSYSIGGHNYLNATKLKVVPVDSAVDISSSEKGVVVITLTDNSSAPIAGATFKYTVNGGEEQTNVTGEDGKFTITGLTGEVTIAVSYEGNESFNGISDSKFFNFTEEPVVPPKVATKITAPKVTATYNVAKKLVITLTDKDGKVLANKKVTVKVGTISKTLNTNAKGQVSLNVATLVPKTYTATVKFAGDDSYIASSVSPKVVVSKAKPKITAKAKTFKVKVKTKKYTVTLKNNKGKVMKKVKLTLKVGKKTYKATTNSKGKATFKITKLTKKGKYTAKVKFAGNKYYKALSKKAKITVKK